MKPNQKETQIMSASSAYYQPVGPIFMTALIPLLRHVTTRSVAIVMFVALAFLSSTHGKDAEPRASAGGQAAKTEVVIDNFTFSPKTLTVPAGATVTWMNHDSVPHLVVSADNQFQKSPALKTGQSFSYSFTTTGIYSYYCSIHPRMAGKIIVK
jgi:plastocyanin